jgi:tetrahydromethanopterin S-methyltransferase subunit G
MAGEGVDDHVVQLIEAQFNGLHSRLNDIREDLGRRVDNLAAQVDKTNGRVTRQERKQIMHTARIQEISTQLLILRRKMKEQTSGLGATLMTMGSWKTFTGRVTFFIVAAYGAIEIGLKIWEAVK